MVSLREVTDEDTPFILSLFANVRERELGMMPLGPDQRSAMIQMQFRAQKGSYLSAYPNASYHIICLDQSPIGNMTTNVGEDTITLIDIALLSAHRGKGIGTSLIRQLIEIAEQSGKSLRLHVESSNPARDLYLRLGFREVENDGVYIAMTRP